MKPLALALCVALSAVIAACGDNETQRSEDCTTPGDEDGDGAADCADTSCSAAPACRPACGNGRLEAGEACDDGNAASGDGCDANCTATACGNGVLTMNEGCDDGNATSGDGCDANCMTTGCGNGVQTGTEACDDGNTTSGDGCDNNCTASACGNGVQAGTEACDDGNTANGDGCDTNCTVSACGNGVPAGTEACDDGNTTNGDGCDNNCTASACGNGIPAGTEACDDGNTTNGDGCDNNCTATGCGNGIPTQGEECDDGNTNNNDACTNTCQAPVCGDGILEGGEDCDDGNVIEGDGCDSNCTVTGCGNGVVTAGEACDDGNATALDGCSPVCVIEPLEVEPNEDGTISTGGSGINGNDFGIANPDANGAFTGPIVIRGGITPAGDEDIFKFTNASAGNVSLRLDVWNPALGIDVPCGTTVDTGMQVKTAAGTSIVSNDDRSGAADRCSGAAVPLLPGASVYVQLMEFGDDLAIPSYALEARYTAITCGDGVVTAPETCDDGNATPDDGCSATCQIETKPEVEPNNTTAEATASPLQVTLDTNVAGAITPVGDRDVYRVEVATPTVVRFEALTSFFDCTSATTLDLRLLDAAGATIIADTAGAGAGGCGAIVTHLAAGTYFIQIEERGNNAQVPAYFLAIDYQTDKGSEAEPANTSGVNDTFGTASPNLLSADEMWVFGDHQLAGDIDVYAITVPPGARIRAEVVEGDAASETCESNGVDSRLVLLNQNGSSLVDDDDSGRGFCSLIDGTGSSPANSLARNSTPTTQTYYLVVRQAANANANGANFLYRLNVSLR